MARIRRTFKNTDVEFMIHSNYDIDDWVDSLSAGLTRKILARVRNYMKVEIERRFSRQRGPDRRRWARLSPLTKAVKSSPTILFKRGKLKRSIRVAMYGEEFVMSSSLPYASVHQKGAKYKTTPKQSLYLWHHLFRKTGPPLKSRHIFLPARPFMGYGKADITAIDKIVRTAAKESERLGTHAI